MSLTLAERLARVRGEVAEAAVRTGRDPSELTLIAVSKRAGVKAVRQAAALGQVDFGENYVQAGIAKMDAAAVPGLRWHMIGQLQSNKAAKAASHFTMIHSLTSIRSARAISRAVAGGSSDYSLLIQIRLGGGAQRGGVEPDEAEALAGAIAELPGLVVRGVMAVAPIGEPARPHFARLRELAERLRGLRLPNAPFDHISAGMSADYAEAIAEGATMIRIGRAIFGA